MRPFDFARPGSIAEAVALLETPGTSGPNGTRPLAGGTDLLTLMKADLYTPERLIDIKRLTELDNRIEEGPDGLSIGALTTLAQLEEDPRVRVNSPALAEAAALAATPQLRNMATIGGNLLQRPRCWYYRNPRISCWLKGGDDCPARPGENQLHALFDVSPCVAVHPSDPATALVALDASVQLRGVQGERNLPLNEFFAAPTGARRTENVIRDDELIVSLHIPATSGGRSTYLKAMDRKVWAFALVSVAAVVRMDGTRIADSRIVLGGVAPVPWRAAAAERILSGAELSEELIALAAEAALDGAQPLTHNGYKIPLTTALVRRALRSVMGDGSLRSR
ncbi:MAG TPA: xanthine dehydrogenase family protein subunit M [Thermomicrobiales bacterium]|nr:xanthine dehydrogenase family protein subunit M [Thermomicrobiales bacterium]